MKSAEFRYDAMTWPDVKVAINEDRVAILPVGTIEQHGKHLPVGADAYIGTEICQKVAETMPSQVVLMPSVVYGYSPHHMDFPGSIGIEWRNFIGYALDICRSLAHQGFRRILIVNSHGSNTHLLNQVARQTNLEHPETLCALVSCTPSTPRVNQTIEKIRKSGWGGISHACEIETSILLARTPEFVKMDKAERDISWPKSDYIYYDVSDGPVVLYPYWSTISRTGTMGDPTKATKEKGEILLKVCVEELVNIVRDFRRRPVIERVDHRPRRSPKKTKRS